MTKLTLETVAFGGGCFWCTEAVFQGLKGVKKVESGFMGGEIKNPAYREVVEGRTGHAETILIEFDTSITSYEELLKVFFMTHDPTTLNRQQNDVGPQYRSVIFYYTPQQKQVANQLIQGLNASVFSGKIVTELKTAGTFYKADEIHQNFYQNHRDFPYCKIIIDPKMAKLKSYFSELLREE